MTRAVLAMTLVLGLTAAPAHGWRRPVPGAVARAFAYSAADPFAAGRHRGVDLAGAPGEVVRAACSGRVAYAGPGVVTLRCGPWRVTHLPLATLAVQAGARVREGARRGTLAASAEHAGLHLGVRRAGDRFAYVDPLPFLGPPVPRVGPPGVPRRVAPRVGPPGVSRRVAPGVRPPGVSRRAGARPPGVAPRVPPAREAVRTRPLAPWPVWLGLALMLAGAVGGGIRVRVRSQRALTAAVRATPPPNLRARA
jgi:hypothetical protein